MRSTNFPSIRLEHLIKWFFNVSRLGLGILIIKWANLERANVLITSILHNNVSCLFDQAFNNFKIPSTFSVQFNVTIFSTSPPYRKRNLLFIPYINPFYDILTIIKNGECFLNKTPRNKIKRFFQYQLIAGVTEYY